MTGLEQLSTTCHKQCWFFSTSNHLGLLPVPDYPLLLLRWWAAVALVCINTFHSLMQVWVTWSSGCWGSLIEASISNLWSYPERTPCFVLASRASYLKNNLIARLNTCFDWCCQPWSIQSKFCMLRLEHTPHCCFREWLTQIQHRLELKRAATVVSLDSKAASLGNGIFKLRCSNRSFLFWESQNSTIPEREMQNLQPL